tara:strand:- start:240 stop:404 length:165 start_codon:yes stop_codon:yes gene_type:complete
MFDNLIYKILDKIVSTCECIKYMIQNRSLPKATYDEKTRSKEVKEWAKNNEDCQ